MKMLEIQDKNVWEEFLQDVAKKTFLHSWAWGEFQKTLGEKIWRLGMYEGNTLIGVSLVIKVKARRGSFLFVPHGPIIAKSKIKNQKSKLQSKIQNLIQHLKQLARDENCNFLRVSPILEDTEENRNLFKGLGFRDAPLHMHAELTWILDIAESEEEILAGMRKTTRNLIKRGEKEGVEVVKGSLEEFNELYQETVKRQKFVAFPKNYLQKERQAFGEDGEVLLAKHEGKTLAGAFIVFYDDTVYYHHGASVHSSIPAAYTLQWEIIKEAKKRGMKWYNFWGVVREDDVKHPWWGLSLFKRGFGGKEWPLMHAQDLPLSWRYWISWVIETARKRRRGY